MLNRVDNTDTMVLPIYRFKYFTDVMQIDWGENNVKKKFALISAKKINQGSGATVKVIHPLSEFILQRYSAKSFNTMKKHSDNIVKFLNYIHLNEKRLEIESLTELKLSHVTNFLNQLEVSGGTVRQYERTLTNFYVFLSRKGFLPEIEEKEFVQKELQWGSSKTTYYKSPFKGVIYPRLAEDKKEHLFPLKYFPLLLEITVIEAPRIALGIYLQFMGGLRCGEVVNLSRAQVTRRIKNGDFILNIKNRNYRTDIKDQTSSEVKRPRTQEVFNVKGWLTVLFEDHIARFRSINGSDALFINARGKAMTAKSYNQYFNNVKQAFCNYLKVYGDVDDIAVADHLRMVDWSTHIGRGTFTNMVAERTDNPFLIAYKRGDKHITSALPYIAKTSRLREKIEDAFKELNNDYIPRLLERRNRC